jgi:hypothetical protein
MSKEAPRRAPKFHFAASVLVLLAAAAASAALGASPAPAPSEEFFIVSSVDPGKGTMVLKRPTEVTLTMRVTEKTRCLDEGGKTIRATDLRAGDTVFIASESHGAGPALALSIRLGAMTVPELHRRYLRF